MIKRYHGFVHIRHLSHKNLPDSDRDLHPLRSPDSHFLGSQHSSQRQDLEKREMENHRSDMMLQLVLTAVRGWGQDRDGGWVIENECGCSWGGPSTGWLGWSRPWGDGTGLWKLSSAPESYSACAWVFCPKTTQVLCALDCQPGPRDHVSDK